MQKPLICRLRIDAVAAPSQVSETAQRAAVESRGTHARDLTFTVPEDPFDDGARAPVAVACCADASGSMEDMGAVVAAITFVLEQLAPGDFFALMVFSDDVRVLAPPQAWTAAGAAAALKCLAACPAEGRTNLAEATTEAIAAAKAMVQMASESGLAAAYISPIVIGITDGHPTEEFGGPLEVVRRVLHQGRAPSRAPADERADCGPP